MGMNSLFGDISALSAYAPTQNYLQGLQNQYDQDQQLAQQQISKSNFWKSGGGSVLALLAGGLLGGGIAGQRGALTMGLMGPLLANSYANNRQQSILNNLAASGKTLTERAKLGMDLSQRGAAAQHYYLGTGVNPGAFVSDELAKTGVDQSSSARNKATGLKGVKAANEYGFPYGQGNAVNPVFGGTPTEQFAKGVMAPGRTINMEDPKLEDLVLQGQAARNNMTDEYGNPLPMPYTGFESPTVITNMLDNATRSLTNGVSEGVKAATVPSQIKENQAQALNAETQARLRQLLINNGYPEAVVKNLLEFNPTQAQLPPVGAIELLSRLGLGVNQEQSKQPDWFGNNGPNQGTINAYQQIIDLIRNSYPGLGGAPTSPASPTPKPAVRSSKSPSSGNKVHGIVVP